MEASCFHRGAERKPYYDQIAIADMTKIIMDIEDFYDEAARRLPVKEIPELLSCINAGGHCFGLADPVTNIILNAIALLSGEHLPSPPLEPPAGGWCQIATQSYWGLRAFMSAYFRYLSSAEARRYLCVASHDLSVAIGLVRYDRSVKPVDPLPDGGRMEAALTAAALEAGHPAPDVLARLMTAQYPSDMLRPIMDILQQQQPLSTKCVSKISDLLARQWPPNQPPAYIKFRFRPDEGVFRDGTLLDGSLQLSTCIGQGLIAHIKIQNIQDHFQSVGQPEYITRVTFRDEYMQPKLSKCFYNTMPCELMESIPPLLHDKIHGFYIKALAILPNAAWSPRFLRALLLAGHCYGPFDAVSNIILSSTWYNIAFPPEQGAESQLPQGILSTKSLFRLEKCSLKGMIDLMWNVSGTIMDDQALHLLNMCNCDMSSYVIEIHEGFNPFANATIAAKHPQQAAFADFLGSLSGRIDIIHMLSAYLKPPSTGRIPDLEWNMINAAIREVCIQVPVAAQMEMDAPPRQMSWELMYWEDCRFTTEQRAPLGTPGLVKFRPKEIQSLYSKPSPVSLFAPRGMFQFDSPAIKALAFRKKLDFVRTKLNKLLQEYCYQHPWEPRYELDIVCGVMESTRSSGNATLYHANFLVSKAAVSDSYERERELFFAEFWETSSPHATESKPSYCSLVYHYIEHAGRCTICETNGSRIVHPPSGGHSGDIRGFVDLFPIYPKYPYKGLVNMQEPDILYGGYSSQ